MKPKVKREQAVELWKMLFDKGYLMRRDLPINNRTVRAICEAYPKHFMSCQKGYCLTHQAPQEDIEQSIAHMHSQSAKMTARANALQRVLDDRTQEDLF